MTDRTTIHPTTPTWPPCPPWCQEHWDSADSFPHERPEEHTRHHRAAEQVLLTTGRHPTEVTMRLDRVDVGGRAGTARITVEGLESDTWLTETDGERFGHLVLHMASMARIGNGAF